MISWWKRRREARINEAKAHLACEEQAREAKHQRLVAQNAAAREARLILARSRNAVEASVDRIARHVLETRSEVFSQCGVGSYAVSLNIDGVEAVIHAWTKWAREEACRGDGEAILDRRLSPKTFRCYGDSYGRQSDEIDLERKKRQYEMISRLSGATYRNIQNTLEEVADWFTFHDYVETEDETEDETSPEPKLGVGVRWPQFGTVHTYSQDYFVVRPL